MIYEYMDLGQKRVRQHFFQLFYSRRNNVYKYDGVYIGMAFVLFTQEKQAGVREFTYMGLSPHFSGTFVNQQAEQNLCLKLQ